MSSEWTVVDRNNRKVKVVKQPTAVVKTKLTADNLRHEDTERYYEEEERKWEEEWERERIEEKKYVVEQTANLSEKEKRLWILEYEHQKCCEIDWDMDDGIETVK